MTNIIDLETLELRDLFKFPQGIEVVGKEIDKRMREMNANSIKSEVIDKELDSVQTGYVFDFVENIKAITDGIASWNKNFDFK